MADFSLTTVFVVPVGNTVPSTGSTQNLAAGQVGIFLNDYSAATAGNVAAAPYFYIAQGRTNTYLQGSKRSAKIKGCPSGTGCNSNVTEWYKVTGCPTPVNQIIDIGSWNVQCGDIVTLTIRAHSSYIDTLYFNGLTRSVTVNAPCCACGADPCTQVDYNALINAFIVKLNATASDFLLPGSTGSNPDNIYLSQFFTFTNVGGTVLEIQGKPLTKYGQPCDVSAFPFEYDRMWFRTFVYSGPATTADFIVSDACNIVATSTTTQNSNYAKGTDAEIQQLEKNYYSYQAGYLKHMYRLMGYNGNYEDWVTAGTIYNTYYIKFNGLDRNEENWGDYIPEDSMVIIAVQKSSAAETAIVNILTPALGSPTDDSGACITTTSTTTIAPTTTTTTTGIG